MPYFGTTGDDTLDENAELNFIYYYGDLGRDLILFGNKSGDPVGLWSVYIEGGPGDDVLTGNISGDELYGGADKDICYGNGGDDQVYGGGGDDGLTGNDGFDELSGGFGNDYLGGGNHNDFLDGGWGNDTLEGGAGFDFLSAGGNLDIASYSSSAALLVDLLNTALNTGDAAGDSYDSIEGLQGTFGTDTLRGDNLGNTLYGSGGNDRLEGRGDFDYLFGEGAIDGLFGGDGDDYLDGGEQNDNLVGGLGSDYQLGGAGNDVFRYTQASESTQALVGRDTIADFTRGADKVNVFAIDARPTIGGNQAFIIDTGGGLQVGEVGFTVVGGSNLALRFNISGDANPEMVILVENITAFGAADIVL